MSDAPGIEQGLAEQDEQETGSGSVLNKLRQKRVEAQQPHFLDLDIPGYEGLLVARYKVVPFKVFQEQEKRVRGDKSGPKMFLLAMDQMIGCCEEMLVRDPGHPACLENEDGTKSDLRPIDPQAKEHGSPIKWEPRLANLLDIPESEHMNQARLVIKAVFGNEPAIVQHSTRIGIWLKDTSKDVDDEFLGE